MKVFIGADVRDDERRIAGRAERVGAAFARELPLLNPLPESDFDASTPLSCRVGRTVPTEAPRAWKQ